MSYDLKLTDNDLDINPDGGLQTVSDNNKLLQDILKAVLTTKGSNRFFRWYGSSISSRIIGQNLDFSQIEVEIQSSIQETLSNIVALQNAQSKEQYVSAGETIASIRGVSVLRNPEDPRLFEVMISILTRKLTVVEETFSLRL
jgi:hypothetical protein